MFQHTAARRRLGLSVGNVGLRTGGFNTQPPEGGWLGGAAMSRSEACFNTQPLEGGWGFPWEMSVYAQAVSTHSRPKAAEVLSNRQIRAVLFQHTAA